MVITSITMDGAALDLNDVLASVTIRHGRADVYDAATPSACQLTVEDAPHAMVRAFHVGGTLVIMAKEGAAAPVARFTGKTTDASLDDAELTVIAVGLLSTLAQHTVGAVDYPAEAWSARVTRVFNEAGLAASLVLQAPPAAKDPQLAARVAANEQPETLDAMLADLAGMVGAAVADTPDGKILVQAISARTLAAMTPLDPNVVTYVPAFVQVLPLTNVVNVEWTGGVQTAQDPESVARFGPRPDDVKTTFTTAADALARAQERVSRNAWPHWNMPSAPVLVGLPLSIGTPIKVTELPPAAPYDPWTPVLEGWQDTITADHGALQWTMELALSDPLASGLTLPWNAVPNDAAHRWNTINATVTWRDALTLDSLDP